MHAARIGDAANSPISEDGRLQPLLPTGSEVVDDSPRLLSYLR